MSIMKAIEGQPYGEPQPNLNLANIESSEYRPVVSFSVSKVYNTANIPAAASGNTSLIIWVTDAPEGQKLQYSDGTNWLPLTY